MNKRLQVIKYVIADVLAAALAWAFFFIFRKYVVDHQVFNHMSTIFMDPKLYLGELVIPIFLADPLYSYRYLP